MLYKGRSANKNYRNDTYLLFLIKLYLTVFITPEMYVNSRLNYRFDHCKLNIKLSCF